MAWTNPTTRSTGNLITASIWNTDVVNNLSYLCSSGLLGPTAFGTHSFVGAGTGAQVLNLRNTTAGTGNMAYVSVGTDVTADQIFLAAYSSTFSTSTYQVASGNTLGAQGSGGLSIAALNASGDIRFYAGGSTQSAILQGITSSFGPKFSVGPSAVGTGAKGGCYVYCGRNSSGNGAAGLLVLVPRDNTGPYYLWTDTSGNIRIQSGAFPTEDNSTTDTSGTVVGTQSSTRASKVITSQFRDTKRALSTLLKTPLYRFRYKSGAYNGTEFVGITTDDSPEFGMDEGRSFNPVSTCGYLIAGVQELARRLDALEAAR